MHGRRTPGTALHNARDRCDVLAMAEGAHLDKDLPPRALRVVEQVARMHDAAAEAEEVPDVHRHLEVHLQPPALS